MVPVSPARRRSGRGGEWLRALRVPAELLGVVLGVRDHEVESVRDPGELGIAACQLPVQLGVMRKKWGGVML
jgi:hypothetical protein